MIWHDVEQNTDAWYALRGGKVTGSGLSKIMANFGKAFGEPAKKYAVDIAIERITGNPVSSSFYNEHMARGHEEEPIARMAYEDRYFCDALNGGFFDCGDYGCSVDFMVGDYGLGEIKSHIPSAHYAIIKKQYFETAYKWQMVGNMKYTGRDWIDYVSYCSSFPENSRLYVYRLKKEDFQKEFDMIDQRMEEFMPLVDEAESLIRNSNFQ